MMIIDKLCYNSRLRYEMPVKVAFAMITLFICVMSRSIAVACIVLSVTGILTVCKGGIPCFPLSPLFNGSPGIFTDEHPCHYAAYPAHAYGLLRGSHRQLVSHFQRAFFFVCLAVDSHRPVSRFLPVFSFFYNANAGHSRGAA